MPASDFKVIGNIGKGAYSTVQKVQRKSDGQIYALKRVMLKGLSKKEKENALNEVRILASVQHPNIISYKEAFLEDEPAALCIIMEFADGGDLYQKIVDQKKKKKLFSEAEIWETFIQVVKGLNALHKK